MKGEHQNRILREIWFKRVEWIKLAQVRLNIGGISSKAVNFLPAELVSTAQIRHCTTELFMNNGWNRE
jgi:hypothetical protein